MVEQAGVGLAAESKGELKERDGRAPARAEAVIHDLDIRMSTAHFSIEDDEADCPVGHAAQDDEEDQAGEEAGLADSVR